MEVHFPPEVHEKLVDSAAKQGRDAGELVNDVLVRYLADEARFFEAVEGWTEEERQAAISHINEGFLQSERGELIGSAQARREIQELKNNWRQERSPTR